EVPGVIPYRPASELWSDNASKERYMALPGLEQITRTEHDGWIFPEGSVLIKNFSLPMDERYPEITRRIETRLMIFLNATWHGFSYAWNEDETDAELLEGAMDRDFSVISPDGNARTKTWHYPSRTECFSCHTEAAGRVLGPTTAQLNSSFTYSKTGVTDNQLRAMDYIGLFDEPLVAEPEMLPKMPDYEDVLAPMESRVKSYFASNCSMCHRPGTGVPSSMDLRWETPLASMKVLGRKPGRGSLGIRSPQIIKPGCADHSVLLTRMSTREPGLQMPQLGTHEVDEPATALIHVWIRS